MVQGRLEISSEKSGARGFQKNVSRGLQKKMCPEVCRKNVSRVSPYTTVVRPSTISNVFSSETAWPIKAKFYGEPPWEGGTKVYINGPGHMTKMAAMPIYGKNLKKSSSPVPEVL